MAKYTSKPWDGSKSRFTIEQLLRSIPKAFAEYARTQKNDKGEIPKSACKCPFREPTGIINLNGVRNALARCSQVKGPSAQQKARARVELTKHLNAGKGSKGTEAFAFTDSSWIEPNSLDELIMACPISVLKLAIEISEDEERDITKKDLGLAIFEQNGALNLHALSQALEDVETISDLSLSQIAEIRFELRAYQELSSPVTEIDPKHNPYYDWKGDEQDFDPYIEGPYKDGMYHPRKSQGLYTVDQNDFDPQSWGYNQGQSNIVPHNGFSPSDWGWFKAQNPGYDDNGDWIGPGDVGLRAQSVSSPDYRPMPNFRLLGIDRPAGPATNEELAAFKGASKPDGTAPSNDDYYSVGVLLANNDYMPDRGQVIPGLELARLGRILEFRSKGSDEDHSRAVGTGTFLLTNPKIGIDPNIPLHRDNPLRGKEPYTALTARAIFPKTSNSPNHQEMLEKVMRGLARNVSITPQVGAITCSACGEMPIAEMMKVGDHVTGLRFNPVWVESLSPMDLRGLVGSSLVLRSLDPHYPDPYPAIRDGQPNGVWDTNTVDNKDKLAANKGPWDQIKDGSPDGLLYSDLRITGVDENSGIVHCAPVMFPTRDPIRDGIGMVAMNKVLSADEMYSGLRSEGERIELSSPDTPRMCMLHGLVNSTHPMAGKVTGVWTGIKQLFNVALVDAGAINDARLVLDPDENY